MCLLFHLKIDIAIFIPSFIFIPDFPLGFFDIAIFIPSFIFLFIHFHTRFSSEGQHPYQHLKHLAINSHLR